MEVSITDKILYTQLLTEAGFGVRSMTGKKHTRGNGVVLCGEFMDGNRGQVLTEVEVEESKHGIDPALILEGATVGMVLINGMRHYVNVRPNGSFTLAVAHGDGD